MLANLASKSLIGLKKLKKWCPMNLLPMASGDVEVDTSAAESSLSSRKVNYPVCATAILPNISPP
jgi:hypothetical protein